jgi:PKD repeat protein
VTFDGTASYDADGSIASYDWAFGDGSTGSGAVLTHAYAAAGTYTATLTVWDNLAKSATDTVAVSVVDPSAVAAPTGLGASVASRTVTLRWTDNAFNETGYYVERGTYNSRTKVYAWTRVATLTANAQSYAESVARGTWYYRVQAYSSTLGKTSPYSNTVKVSVK